MNTSVKGGYLVAVYSTEPPVSASSSSRMKYR